MPDSNNEKPSATSPIEDSGSAKAGGMVSITGSRRGFVATRADV